MHPLFWLLFMFLRICFSFGCFSVGSLLIFFSPKCSVLWEQTHHDCILLMQPQPLSFTVSVWCGCFFPFWMRTCIFICVCVHKHILRIVHIHYVFLSTQIYSLAHFRGAEICNKPLHSRLMWAEEAEVIATDTLSKLMFLSCMYLGNILK